MMSRIEDNPFSEWTSLLTQLVRASLDSHGRCERIMTENMCSPESPAFTAEQMSKLSDILEAALPRSTSSPAGGRTAVHTPESTHSNTSNKGPLQSNRNSNVPVFNSDRSPYGDLAKEFGVEPHLVEALAQRLSRIS